MAGLAGLHHVALSVQDLDRSIAWYREVLGLSEDGRVSSGDRRSAILCLPGTAQQLGLVEHEGAGAGFDPRSHGLDHVAFSVRSLEELEEWGARLSDHGVDSSGALETPFGGMLHFKDPDGIALAVFWNR